MLTRFSFRLKARYFFLPRQVKVPKKKATPYRLSPALLKLAWRQSETRQKPLGSNSRLPKSPIKLALLGAVEGD